MPKKHMPLKFSMCILADYVSCNYVNDDTASMALPSGQAASTRASWYLTFFTNVISCHGSRPVQQTKAEWNIRVLLGFSGQNIIMNLHKWLKCECNLPNPSTSKVYWYKRSMHKNGRLPSSTCGYMGLASASLVSQARLAASSKSAGWTLAIGTFGSARPAYMCKWVISMAMHKYKRNSKFFILISQATKSRMIDYLSSPVKEKWSNKKILLSISTSTIPYPTKCAFHVLARWFINFESIRSYPPALINVWARRGCKCFILHSSIFVSPLQKTKNETKKTQKGTHTHSLTLSLQLSMLHSLPKRVNEDSYISPTSCCSKILNTIAQSRKFSKHLKMSHRNAGERKSWERERERDQLWQLTGKQEAHCLN